MAIPVTDMTDPTFDPTWRGTVRRRQAAASAAGADADVRRPGRFSTETGPGADEVLEAAAAAEAQRSGRSAPGPDENARSSRVV